MPYFRPTSASRELHRQLKRLELCLPRPAKMPPAGPGWIHEIKHDGFRILAEHDATGVTLHTRRGYDFADRFPLAAAAVAKLRVKSCLIDGEAIVCDANGLAVFDLVRRRGRGEDVILCAFDRWNLTGWICAECPSSNVRRRWRTSCAGRATASPSMSITLTMGRSSTGTPAHSAARASYRSGWGRRTAAAGQLIGTRSKILIRLRLRGKKKRIGPK
jgi:hypothetical protein